jgi:hypothetical protein
MPRMNVDVRVQRSRVRAGYYSAQACVRAARGERYARHVMVGGRCGNGEVRRTPKKAIASALQALGRRMARKAR